MRPHCLEIHFEEGRGGEKTPIGEKKRTKLEIENLFLCLYCIVSFI
jgi:hypothetical protein